MDFSDTLAAAGVFLILLAFLANLAGWMHRDSRLYLLLNLVGATLACIAALFIPFWPFVVMEAVWAGAALFGLMRQRSGTEVRAR